MNILEFRGVGFGYPGQALILSKVDFRLARGERILILGSNGAGKSTLALLAAGLLQAAEGEIVHHSLHKRPLRTGIVFQNSRTQIVGSTVEEDLAFGLTVRQYTSRQIKIQVDHYLELFGLDAKRHFSVEQLSGGELRRLGLASVLITQPELLILDEPLAMLAGEDQRILINHLMHTVPQETAMIWLDHDLKVVRYLPKWYLLNQAGAIVALSLEELSSPQLFKAHSLQPAPLQPLEWKYPQVVSKAIFGAEMIEWDYDKS